MITCLLLGLGLYVYEALTIAVILFVISVLSMLIGMVFFISEVSIALTSVKEEETLYNLIDLIDLTSGEQ